MATSVSDLPRLAGVGGLPRLADVGDLKLVRVVNSC